MVWPVIQKAPAIDPIGPCRYRSLVVVGSELDCGAK